MERIGQWLAGRPWNAATPQELEERVEAVVTRVDGLENRVEELETAQTRERQGNGPR